MRRVGRGGRVGRAEGLGLYRGVALRASSPRRWETLAAVGLNLTSHVYIVSNARDYKPIEFWAFGRGIPLTHIINTGATIGPAWCVR